VGGAGSTRPNDVLQAQGIVLSGSRRTATELCRIDRLVSTRIASGPFHGDEIIQLCSERVTQRLLKRSSLRNCRHVQFVLTVWDTGKIV
jgi:hypothetical protein